MGRDEATKFWEYFEGLPTRVQLNYMNERFGELAFDITREWDEEQLSEEYKFLKKLQAQEELHEADKMEELKPSKKVEEIMSNVQNRELEKLYLLVDEFLGSEAVQKNLTFLKPYYIAEYLLQKENQRAKRSDVLSIASTPKQKENDE